MQVDFTKITINRSFKVFLIVFVVVLILSFVSGFHFYLWWRKVSGRHTSCVPRLESRTFRRELLSCTQTTFTFSQIFQNSSFQQTWSTSTVLFLQVIWFHCDYQNPNKAFIEISTRLCITCLVHNCKCFAASKLIQHQWCCTTAGIHWNVIRPFSLLQLLDCQWYFMHCTYNVYTNSHCTQSSCQNGLFKSINFRKVSNFHIHSSPQGHSLKCHYSLSNAACHS